MRILVIEDEPTIIEFLRTGLRYEGAEVLVAEDGQTGLQMASDEGLDLVILDVMLPDLDGFEVCRRLRARGSTIPIIMLTARRELSDRVAGLDAGADDYLTKPFSFEELLARMRAVLRRSGRAPEPELLSVGSLSLDPDAHEARRGGELLELTPTEFALLELFLRHPRRVFTRETLLNRVWGFEYAGDTNVVDVHVSHLRAKLGAARSLLHTVYGVGYSLRPEAE
jgi:DNA-binding response OmpR family regulator